jgi:hypothetical protein
MQSSAEPCPQLTSQALPPEAEHDDTTRRQAFYKAAESFSAQCDQNEHEGLPAAKKTKRSHEGKQLRHNRVDKPPGATHKKAKGKLPTRSQPSRAKSIPSASAFHIASTKPKPRTTQEHLMSYYVNNIWTSSPIFKCRIPNNHRLQSCAQLTTTT